MTDPTRVEIEPGHGSGGGSPVEAVVLRSLDRAALHELRTWLRRASLQPGVLIDVDLADSEQPHQHTVVALLAEAARRARSRGGQVRVRRPPPSMVAVLRAVGLDDLSETLAAGEGLAQHSAINSSGVSY